MSDAFPALPAIPSFSIARLPRIEFGSGALSRLPDIAAGYGRNLLLVTGLRSLDESGAGKRLFAQLAQRGLSWEQVRVAGEPSPEWIDATVAAWRERPFDCVVGIGGGSALDAAKAIDRPNTIWTSRRKPPDVSPKARDSPVTMMMITATILATGPSTDCRI